MNEQKFKKWLRGEYRLSAESQKDAQGGYLIPHFVTTNSPGRLAAFYRFVGMILRNTKIYERGTYQYDFYGAILRKVKDSGTNNPG